MAPEPLRLLMTRTYRSTSVSVLRPDAGLGFSTDPSIYRMPLTPERLMTFPLPIVTAIQGAAMGLGANVAFATDIVVAWREARLADPHVKIGLVAGDGGAVLWPLSAGVLRAKRYLLTGDVLTAADAHSFGLVTDLVDHPEDVLPRARALAEQVAALPPLAVQGTKAALNRLVSQRAGEVLQLSLQLEAMTMASEDVVEAATAFLEKRPGTYQGR